MSSLLNSQAAPSPAAAELPTEETPKRQRPPAFLRNEDGTLTLSKVSNETGKPWTVDELTALLHRVLQRSVHNTNRRKRLLQNLDRVNMALTHRNQRIEDLEALLKSKLLKKFK